MRVPLAIGEGRLATVKEGSNRSTFNKEIGTLNTHTAANKSSRDLAARRD
jgi:hypothetical protein